MADPLSAPADPHWVPMQILWTAPQPVVDWCHLGAERFTDPFFVQTIAVAMRHPFNLLFRRRTPLDALAVLEAPELRPAGFIFHTSHCGSTLVAQMLAALPCNVVLSEPRPLDHILRAAARQPSFASDRLARWLSVIAAAFGRRRFAEERDLFVKFEGWHILLLPLIRRAFPDVPWIFVYRDPLDVLARLAEEFPAEIEPSLLGLSWQNARELSSAGYCALVLERIYAAAAAQCRQSGGLLIEYRELPDAVCGRMLDFFSLRYDPEQLMRMRETARFNAKAPTRLFADDTAQKRATASAEVAELAATRLAPLYRELEALRLAGKIAAPSPCAPAP
jgi:hypothetical protein